MVIKVGINGFGRVGRIVFRNCLERPEVEVCAINDPAIEIDYICYLMKYDSTHGTLQKHITSTDNEIIIDGDLHIKVFQKKYPNGIPWDCAGAEYVVEASGMFTNMEKASGHLSSGCVKKVIVTAPCPDVPILIFGVNELKIKPDAKVISCGSSTLYCLAPIIKLLEENYGLEEGFCTSIHAMTPSLKPLDGLCLKGNHWRDHRSITQNIIPAATGACKALGRILPAVKDRVSGLAFRVPVANVSVLDLTVRLRTITSLQNITSDIVKFSEKTKNIIRTNADEVVSSDFAEDSCSCILDLNSSFQINGTSFKLICWYENEYSYACRVVDLIVYSEKQLKELAAFGTVDGSIPLDTSQENDQIGDTVKTKIAIYRTPINKGSQIQYCTKDTTSSVVTGERKERCMVWKDEIPTGLSLTSFFLTGRPFTPPLCAQPERRLEEIKMGGMCTKAQESLEKVKEEFSKMVLITESLLKKSNSANKPNTSENVVGIRVNEINCNEKSITMLKVTGDSIDTTNSSSNHDMDRSLISCCTINSKNVNNSIVEKLDTTVQDKINSDFSMAPVGTDCIQEANNIKKKSQNPIGNKNIVSKTLTELYNGLSNLQFQFSSIKTYNVAKEQKRERPKSRCESLDDDETHGNAERINATQPITNDQSLTVKQDEKQLIINNTKNAAEKVANKAPKAKSKNIDTETEPTENNVTVIVDIKDESHEENERFHITDDQCDINVDQHCGDHIKVTGSGRLKPDVCKVEGVSADMPVSESVADTAWTSKASYGEKRDIYDKLESNSGSDNSFDIDKKKSDVINITDLTSSLEDLDRLDKICRIMEISDELSDKLFSTLNKNSDGSGVSISNKRWSFKDLCEKVNLDEFCNKVFGK